MTAMILAAGLGTRLRPWTLDNPKALVPVDGVPMLERVIVNLKNQGADKIIINIHHHGEKILQYLEGKDFGIEILVSDEREHLMDTGGAIVKALDLMDENDNCLLVHNVDIISNVDLKEMCVGIGNKADECRLLVSNRESSRKLIFGDDNELIGWHDLKNDAWRFVEIEEGRNSFERAFSGIYLIGRECINEMRTLFGETPFPVMEYFLSSARKKKVYGYDDPNLIMIDIGKPATLSQASDILKLITN